MITNIVIIDDSQYKADTIEGYMQKIFPKAKIDKLEAINTGLMFIRNNLAEIRQNPNHWLVVSDMVMPRYKHEMPERKGGEFVIREINRLDLKCPVILQSSDELDTNKYKEYYSYLLGTIKETSVVYNLEKYRELLKNYII